MEISAVLSMAGSMEKREERWTPDDELPPTLQSELTLNLDDYAESVVVKRSPSSSLGYSFQAEALDSYVKGAL